jgi:hypothetical protein
VARTRVLAVVLTAALAVGVGACGSSSSGSSPQNVQSALKSTAKQSGLQLTLTLHGKVSDFSGSGDAGLTTAQEQAILDSSVALTVHAANGTTLANAGTGGELAFSLSESGSSLVELKVVGSTLFARVDIQKLTAAYGLDTGKVAQFRGQLGRLGSQVGGLGALNNGQWVSLDINLINEFAQTAGLTLPSVPQLVGRVVGAFFNALAQSTNISSAGRGKAQMTVNAQQLVTALAQAVAATPGMSKLSSQINSLAARAHAAVPANKSANVVVTLGGGIVSNLELPLNQFDTSHTMKGPVSANMAVAKSGAVSAPSSAVAINLPQLIHALQGASASS